MRLELLCPACGLRPFDSDEYESMILLAQNLALTQFTCPNCNRSLSVMLRLTQSLHHAALKRLAAQAPTAPAPATPSAEANGGAPAAPAAPATPSASIATPPAPAAPAPISYASPLIIEGGSEDLSFVHPFRFGNPEGRLRLERFKQQLEHIDTVDEALQEIDSGPYREKRDD
ncbi:MAG: hypothetical protein LBO07_05175 [Coriobacteriales bacterium]|nr:hypothetical protein [Coriobacteriales bacterium]